MQPDRPDRGFTLIELLVVISIIALLIGILLPALAAARSGARALTCLTRTRSIAQALTMYLHDHDDRFPTTNHGGFGGGPEWDIQLAPYLGAGSVHMAYVFGDFFFEDNADAVAYYNTQLRCPEDERTATTAFSYGQSVYPSLVPGEPEERVILDGQLWHSARSLPAPAATVMHGEVEGDANHVMAHYWTLYDADPEEELSARHGDRLSTTFADGHATLGAPSETYLKSGVGEAPELDRWNPATAR